MLSHTIDDVLSRSWSLTVITDTLLRCTEKEKVDIAIAPETQKLNWYVSCPRHPTLRHRSRNSISILHHLPS